PERLPTQRVEELGGQGGPVSRVDGVGDELVVRRGDTHAEDAEPERVVGGDTGLMSRALRDDGGRVHVARLEAGGGARGVVPPLGPRPPWGSPAPPHPPGVGTDRPPP